MLTSNRDYEDDLIDQYGLIELLDDVRPALPMDSDKSIFKPNMVKSLSAAAVFALAFALVDNVAQKQDYEFVQGDSQGQPIDQLCDAPVEEDSYG